MVMSKKLKPDKNSAPKTLVSIIRTSIVLPLQTFSTLYSIFRDTSS